MLKQVLILLIGGVLWLVLGALACNSEEQTPVTTDYLQGQWFGGQLLLADRVLDEQIETELLICQDSFLLIQHHVPKSALWADSCWTDERVSVLTRGAYNRGAFEVTFNGNYLNACDSSVYAPYHVTFDAQRNDGGLHLWNDNGIDAQLERSAFSEFCQLFDFD